MKPALKCFDKCLANEHAVSQPDPPIARHIQVKLKDKYIYKMHQHHKLGGGPVDAWVKLLTKDEDKQTAATVGTPVKVSHIASFNACDYQNR